MSFTTESIETPIGQSNNLQPSEFDLPTKEFVGYDPKGTTSVTGSELVRSDKKHPDNDGSNKEVKEES